MSTNKGITQLSFVFWYFFILHVKKIFDIILIFGLVFYILLFFGYHIIRVFKEYKTKKSKLSHSIKVKVLVVQLEILLILLSAYAGLQVMVNYYQNCYVPEKECMLLQSQ